MQSCYWTQQCLKNHKAAHPVREYCLAVSYFLYDLLVLCIWFSTVVCLQTTTGDDVRDFAKQLKYKLLRTYRNKPPKKTYLDYPVTPKAEEER